MKTWSVLLAILLLSSCATVQSVAESPTTFAVCKTVDVATTAYALNSGHFREANPILKPFIGPHHFVPLIAFSFALWWVIQKLNEPKLTMAANAITCGVSAHNIGLLMQ